ncbi:MAG: hypothetical protein L0312_31290, partial [Acidobacteria bacterium]|nr:hypothetical protein [Acidobacteriota bacterium]
MFLLMLLLWSWLHSVPPVSAEELLRRTEQAETQRILNVAGPVVYQKLQVRRNASLPLRDHVVTWEIWNDVRNNRFVQRVEDAQSARFIPPAKASSAGAKPAQGMVSVSSILTELQQILEANRMDIRRPLSPSTYDSWRQRLGRKTEEVIETKLSSGDRGLTLKTSAQGPFTPNAIVQGDLTVRLEDWHPVAQSLKVQGQQGIQSFELAETDFHVVALNTLPPSIFADFTPPVAGGNAEPRVEARAVDAYRATPSVAELMTAEIEARYALHRLGACLGEPIELVRAPGGWIEVRGLVKSSERREELLAELRALPQIKLNLQTMEEAAREVLSQSPIADQAEMERASGLPEENPLGSSAEVQVGQFPVQGDLERYLTETLQVASPVHLQEKVTELSNQAFSLSQSALAEAWALRRLAQWYPPPETHGLSQSTQWLLEAMVQDHVLELSTKISRSRNLLEPVLSSISAAGAALDPTDSKALETAQPGEVPWPDLCLQLFYSIEEADRLTSGLFVGTGLSEEQSQAAVTSLTV